MSAQYEHHFLQIFSSLIEKGRKVLYKKGEIVYFQGDNIDLLFLIKGELRNCVFFDDGTDMTIFRLSAPTMTGETSMIDRLGSLTSVEALTDSVVVIVPAEVAKDFLLNNRNAMECFLKISARKMRSTMVLAENNVMNIQQKLALFLINWAKSAGENNIIRLTHEQIASYLGSSRPKITQKLGQFSRNGYIRISHKKIEILDFEGLNLKIK